MRLRGAVVEGDALDCRHRRRAEEIDQLLAWDGVAGRRKEMNHVETSAQHRR